MFHCIVIDDENLARERITSFVEQQSNWLIDGQAGEYKEAESLLLKHRPDVCFMDINIIGGSGIELAGKLAKSLDCHWVFTTASSDYALQAFDIEATDYLLKPFENSRLAAVLQKVEKLKSSTVKTCKNILAVKSVGAVEFVNVQDIIWIKGSANYVELHCENRMLLHRETLSKLETQLDSQQFIRVHRSAMVNVDKINSLSSELGRFSLLHLNNGDEVKIGQGHKASLFEALGVDS
ncbi:LytR/AlgR family response regulator transcription factor [Paraglaciecola arctica]|uniref:LytR/AlgR family response regulator transcription factor n=1 Tax=Paraglaciecola arctica TaxID=1128911 RepID=UPI001C0660DA|nr:LytTR family DNA-binding domain-containing protein [Paraglaciecola arctica]MBU3004292.1 LytTR family DNA-binding domain-containing protein [Paraglaciecola arctica]